MMEEEANNIVVVGMPGRWLGGDNQVEVIQGQALNPLGDGDVLEILVVPLVKCAIDQ